MYVRPYVIRRRTRVLILCLDLCVLCAGCSLYRHVSSLCDVIVTYQHTLAVLW